MIKKSSFVRKVCALCFASLLAQCVWAANPIAEWAGDFTTKEKGSGTITFKLNDNAAIGDHAISITDTTGPVFVQRINSAGTANTNYKKVMTVVLRYSKYPTLAEDVRAPLITILSNYNNGTAIADGDQYRNITGLCGNKDGKMSEIWGSYAYQWDTNPADLRACDRVALIYNSGSGPVLGSGDKYGIGVAASPLGASNRYSDGFMIGGIKACSNPVTNLNTSFKYNSKGALSTADGLVVTGIAVFDENISIYDLRNFRFSDEGAVSAPLSIYNGKDSSETAATSTDAMDGYTYKFLIPDSSTMPAGTIVNVKRVTFGCGSVNHVGNIPLTIKLGSHVSSKKNGTGDNNSNASHKFANNSFHEDYYFPGPGVPVVVGTEYPFSFHTDVYGSAVKSNPQWYRITPGTGKASVVVESKDGWTDDGKRATQEVLYTIDTIVLNESKWQASKWSLDGFAAYPIKITAHTDIGDIPENACMTISYKNYPESGDKKGVYLRGNIGANATIDGEGALFLGFTDDSTIADGVTISCDVGFQGAGKHQTLAADATLTIEGAYNHISGSSIKLNEGSKIISTQQLPEGAVESNVSNMILSESQNDETGKWEYVLEDVPVATYNGKNYATVALAMAAAATEASAEVPQTVTLIEAIAENIAIPANVTVATTSTAQFTGTVTGDGRIVFEGYLPADNSATAQSFTANTWTGVVEMKNYKRTDNANIIYFGKYANTRSTVALNNVTATMFGNGVNNHHDQTFGTLEIAEGGWTSTADQYGNSPTYYANLTGSGTINVLQKGSGVVNFIGDHSAFRGSIEIATTSNREVFLQPAESTKRTNNVTERAITIASACSMNIPSTATWTAPNGIKIAGTIAGAGNYNAEVALTSASASLSATSVTSVISGVDGLGVNKSTTEGVSTYMLIDAVAQIGENAYQTLAAALAAAKADDEIVIIKDCSDSFDLTKNVIFNVDGNASVSLSGVISGTGKIIKKGTGALTLSGTNTYTGGTEILAGTLSMGNVRALGASGAAVTIGKIDASTRGTLNVYAGAMGLNVTLSGGTIANVSSTDIATNVDQIRSITLTEDSTINCAKRLSLIGNGGTATLKLNGHTLTKTGASSMYLKGTTPDEGVIRIENGYIDPFNGGDYANLTVEIVGGYLDSDNSPLTVKKVVMSSGRIALHDSKLLIINDNLTTTGGTIASAVKFTSGATITPTTPATLSSSLTFAGTINIEAELNSTIATGTGTIGTAPSSITLNGVAGNYKLLADNNKIIVCSNEDLTGEDSTSVADTKTMNYLSIGNGGVYTIDGVGGLQIDTLRLKNGSTLSVDPVRTPVRVMTTLEVAEGATIAIHSNWAGHTTEYAQITCGKMRLLTYPNTFTIDPANITITGLMEGVATELVEETVADAPAVKQLVLYVGDFKTNAKTIRISQFGDSITEGIWRNGYIGTPNYRIPLMHRLEAHGYKPVSNGYRGDLLKNGSIWGSSDANGIPADPAYRLHNGVSAQRIYTGTGRSTRAGFLEGVEAHLEQAGELDVVTLKIGTNDILDGDDVDAMFEGWKKLVNKIIATRPSTRIVVTSVLETRSYNDNGKSYSDKIKAAVEDGVTFPENTVFYVDCRSAAPQYATPENFIDNGQATDWVHPGWTGYNNMADAFLPGVMAAYDASTGRTETPCTTRGAEANVPADTYRKGFVKVAAFDNITGKMSTWGENPYSTLNSDLLSKKVVKVAYYVERKTKTANSNRFVWVDMDPWKTDMTAADVLIPTTTEQKANTIINNLHVFANTTAIKNIGHDVADTKGTLLFTPKYLTAGAGISETGYASAYGYDWNNTLDDSADWGAMIVSRVDPTAGTNRMHASKGDTLFSFNGFNATGKKNILGIGSFSVHGPQIKGNNALMTLSLDWMFHKDENPQLDKMTADNLEYGAIEIWVKYVGQPEEPIVDDKGITPVIDGAETIEITVATGPGEETVTGTTIPLETGVYTVKGKVGDTVVGTQNIGVVAAKAAETATDRVTTAVAVPFKGKTVETLLNTALLAEGDTLMAWVDGAYATWTLDANKEWVGQDVLNGAKAKPATTALKCGQAVWVTTAGKIVTFGDTAAQGADVEIGKGHNLLGSIAYTAAEPSAIDTDQVQLIGEVDAEGNEIITRYNKTSTGWQSKIQKRTYIEAAKKWVTTEETSDEAPTVKPGRGYWLIRK